MQYAKPKVYWLMLIGVIFSILNTSTSYAAPICPQGDKMYYVGASASAPAGSISLALSWTAGSTSKTFNFTDGTGTTMTINFTSLADLDNNFFSQNVPFYQASTSVSKNAITMAHTSKTVGNNHTMTVSSNRAVTQLGFVIQDLDSYANSFNQNPYQEQVDVSRTSGQLTYNTNYHTINASNNIVTAIRGRNCGVNGCNIDATWGAKPANNSFSLTHSNQISQYVQTHAVGYSDFYFCVTPPKLTTKKVLTGNRVEKNDQFTIATTTGTTPVSSFTTTGTGNSLTTDSITATGLSTTATYTIAETIANTDGKGNLAKYSTTYACTNANSSSATTMPSGSATSFNLPTLTYGDDITCTITNTPNAYIFSGKVFNDTTVNGTIDSGESGIAGATINLTDCNVTNLGTTTTDSSGDYIFSFLANDTKITNLSKVCIVEKNAAGYKNDTTANNLTVTLSGVKAYTGNNFGDNNTTGLLQLIKYQQVVPCNTPDLVALDSGFTTADLGVTTKVPSGSCIAYKIEATNLGNVSLTNVVITDSLMNDAKRISKIYAMPTPKLCLSGTATANCDTSKVTAPIDATTGTTKVTTSSFTIPGTGTAANKKASLYFNTLYSLK